MAFVDFTEQQQIPRSFNKKKRHIIVKMQLMVNNQGVIIHKTGYGKGRRNDYDIYKKNHPVISKQVVTVVDLRYLGVEKVLQTTIRTAV